VSKAAAKEALLWIFVPVLIEVGMNLSKFDPDSITNWKAWLIALAALALRQVAKGVVSYLSVKKLAPQNEHAP
jgi:hypothetical protein